MLSQLNFRPIYNANGGDHALVKVHCTLVLVRSLYKSIVIHPDETLLENIFISLPLDVETRILSHIN